MKRILIILISLSILGGGGYFGYQYYLQNYASGAKANETKAETVEVSRQTLTRTVSASGSIEPEAEVEMKFETGGMVSEVLVKEGQTITAGTVLARLDTADLALQVRSAQIDLAQAQANLDQLFEPELAEAVAAARAALASAQANLADLQAGLDPDEVIKAEVTLRQTEIILRQAQWDYDQVSYRGDVAASSEANALQDATLAYESAQADYNLAVKPATPAELAEARSTLASTQSSLAQLLQQPSAPAIASQQANVDQAQLSLEEAQSNLANAVLVAPTGGVVLTVNIEPGERVLTDAAEAALTIANTATYLLKMEVDELDIGQVRQGQPAEVTLDAFGDQTFAGTVTDISPSPSSDGSADSIVTYEVTISLDTQGQTIGFLSGMTANANIQTLELTDVLAIPSLALQTEQSQGQAITYVETLSSQGSGSARVEVEVGLRSGSMVQVIAGLAEGDRVVVQRQTASQSQSTNQTPGDRSTFELK